MNVYIVQRGEFDDRHVESVWSTLHKAKAAYKHLGPFTEERTARNERWWRNSRYHDDFIVIEEHALDAVVEARKAHG